MRVLITGNLGYVGAPLVEHLRAQFPDWELIGFDAGMFAHCLTRPGPLPEVHLAAQHFGDIREFPPQLLRDVDAVVHLAAISNDPIGNRFAGITDLVNRAASLRLAERAREAGVKRFVFASSCSVYGSIGGGPRNESSSVNPLTAYAQSKIGTEEGLGQPDTGNMVVTCLRFGTACGMSPRLRLDLVLNDFVAGALSSGEITLLSDGTSWRPLIDVRDMARAIEWGIVRPVEPGGAFLIVNAGADAANYRVRDLATAVARAVPGTSVSINADARSDARSYRVDFSRFRQLAPDHQPMISLAESIKGLVDGLRAIGFSDRKFRESTLVRLQTLAALIGTRQLTPDLTWIGAAGRPS